MLRKRSGAVGSKQGLMSNSQSLSCSPVKNQNKPTAPSLFPSPRLFRSFSSKGFSDHEAVMSPTSILETKHLSSFGSLFHSDRQLKKPPLETVSAGATTIYNGGLEPVGLGIVDALSDDRAEESPKSQSRMVLFGSQLKIHIPSMNSSSALPARSVDLLSSPIEFGIKNKDSQLALLSPVLRSSLGHDVPASSPRVFAGSISVSEMELSEDYTCVISHGPNKKTTHIFDNCIVESYGDECTATMKKDTSLPSHEDYPPDDFLSFCCSCKKNLGQGKDIFMYRGEEAFCSSECRYNEMFIDEKLNRHSTDSSPTI